MAKDLRMAICKICKVEEQHGGKTTKSFTTDLVHHLKSKDFEVEGC